MGPRRSADLERSLEQQDCSLDAGKGSHPKVMLGYRRSVLPMQGRREIGRELLNKMKRDLGLSKGSMDSKCTNIL